MIELMIALVVISIVSVGFIGANILAQKNNEEMHERTIAIQDANRAIEQIRNVSRIGTFPANVVTAYPHNGTLTGFNDLTAETVRVAYVSATANPLDATVTVSWTSYPQRNNEITIQTYITQR
jgi:type II secretory pathway pseudopilin PulG